MFAGSPRTLSFRAIFAACFNASFSSAFRFFGLGLSP
jgi:hypothetical protein